MGSVGRGRRAAAGLRQHLAVLRVVGEHGGPLGCHGHRCLGGHGHRCLGGHGHRCLRGRGGPTTDSAARLMWAGLRGGGRGCRACGRGTCAAINISALRRRRRLLLLRRITVSGGYLSTTHDRVTTTHRCTGCRRRCGGMVTRRSVSSGRDHAGRTPVIVCTWGHRAEFRMNIAAHRSAQQWQQAQDRYSRSQTRQDCCHGITVWCGCRCRDGGGHSLRRGRRCCSSVDVKPSAPRAALPDSTPSFSAGTNIRQSQPQADGYWVVVHATC
jgi:hypothetical protein